MAHIALYRAWRPQTFRDMVGQQHVIRTLQNAIREDRISHAYLFNGPRGTGKTSAAKIMAKAVNCERGPSPEPCNECPSCVSITSGDHVDVREFDAASNRGIDEIRDIREKVGYAPAGGVRYKVYIIDEVHMLTTEAFNALLKTLEEPPKHVIFILATTEPHKLPATIVSRCQRFDFRQVSLQEQTERLRRICEEESIAADEDALAYVARLSDGGMRDAISLLEQVAAFSGERITLDTAVDVTGGMVGEQFAELADAVRERNVAAILPVIDKLTLAGKSADKCMENLIYYFRDLLLLKLVPGGDAMTERIIDAERFRAMADAFSRDRLFQMIDILNRYQNEMRHAAQPQTLFEVALMKICSLPDSGEAAGGIGGGDGQHAVRQAAADSAGGGGEASGEVARLRRQVENLERKLEQLIASGGGPGRGVAESAAGGAAAERAGSRAGGFGARPGGGSGGGSVAAGLAKLGVKLEAFARSRSTPAAEQIRAKWPEVLQRVKEARISVHAWLIDGEPVAAENDLLLIAFKNTMHRETTEKPANREIIEKVLQDVFGRQVRFATVMQKEWQAAADGAPASGGAEPLVLQQEDGAPAGSGKPEWVEEAIRMFGEDLVVVVDDEKPST